MAAPNVAGGYVAARLCQAVGDRLVANRHTYPKEHFRQRHLPRSQRGNVEKHVEGERIRVSLCSPISTPRDHHDC